jgi:hypothetical protein
MEVSQRCALSQHSSIGFNSFATLKGESTSETEQKKKTYDLLLVV